MDDESMIKIMQTLGLNYDPAIKATEQFEGSMVSLRKDLEFMKSTAIDTAKSINKAFTAEFGKLKAQDIKKIFDQIDRYNKPVEIKVVTDKAEKAMNEFASSMGIKLDKNLKAQFSGLADGIFGDFDQSKFDGLASSIADSYEKAMKKYNTRIQKSNFANTDDAKIYEYLRTATIRLNDSTIDAKKNVTGFSHALQNLTKQSTDSGLALDQMAQELEGVHNIKDLGNTTEDIAERMTLAVERTRELKHGFSDIGIDVPRTEIDKFVQESLNDLVTNLFHIKSEALAANQSLSSLGDTSESASGKTSKLTASQKEQSATIQEAIRQYRAGIMEAKEFIRIADELKVNKSQWDSLPVQAKQDQISLQNSLTKATREYGNSLKELEQYKDALTGTGDFSKQQAQVTNQMNELIRLRKTLQIESKEFMERASKIGPGTKGWDMLNSKDQVKLVNEITKAEKEHKRALLDNEKIISKTNLEKMKAQAASIQQRATTKKLGNEYVKQSSALRKQVEELQSKLQLEGKLSAEEVKQTQQLQKQLNILKAQTASAVSDQTRENPNFLGEEFQRRTSWFLTGTMFYGIVNGAKQATEAIKDVEMGMIEIARVMDDSSFIFEEYRDNLFNLGIEYGQTFDNVQQIALRWAQSGYNVKDSLELAETSLLALNTAELDAQNATEAMIGIMAQWQLEAEDMALVMDKINITADNYSVTSQDLVDGLLRSSGAARVMNMSMEDTIGLLTVMREASGRTGAEVGNALNSILSYIQRPKSIDMLESLGISMFADEAKTQFRGVLDVFKDIASNWNTLSTEIQDGFVASADDAELFNEELAGALGMQDEWNDLQQRDISQASAGVYRRNYFIGMIERLSNVQGVLNNMMDAEGYSMRENEKTMEALDKKQQSLKASMEALAVAAGDAGLGGSLKTLAQGGTGALNVINKMPKGMKDLVMATTSTFLAIKALDLGMKTFGIKLPGVSEVIKELTDGTWSLTKAFKAGKEGIGAFLSANAPLLALSASIGVIVAVTNHMKKEREEKEKAIQVSKENIQSLEEEKQGLTELASEYETLKEKEKNLTATADEKTRLRDIQRELVDLYGVSITGIDAEGKAYADSTEAIRDRIKALEEEKAAETEKLEAAVISKDKQDVAELEKNLAKRKQIAEDLEDTQKKINEQLSILESGGTARVPTGHGRRYDVDASTENGAKLLKEYIGRLNSDKAALKTALDDVDAVIEEGTSDRERLLKEDAAKTVQALSENGVEISDEARAFATEMASALSQAPEDIFTIRDDLEEAIREFNSIKFDGSTFTEWAEKYNEAIANGDNKGIDEAANAINGLVREVSQGKPEMDNFVIAMEGIYPTTVQIASAAENAGKQTLDLAGAMGRMGVTAKKAMDDLKVLNQAIYDVKHGQSLSIDTILELIEKYDLSTDAIKQTTKGYTIEVSALEKLRGTKTQTAIDGIESEKQTTQNTINAVKQRLESYGLEIEMLGNLAEARRVLAQRASKEAKQNVTGSRMEEVGLDVAMKEIYDESMASAWGDIAEYNAAVTAMEELNKRAKLLGGMLGNSDYGVTGSKGKKSSSGSKSKTAEKYENKALDNALKMLEHRKKMTEETQKSIQAEIDALNRINKLYVKTADERMAMAERIYSAEKKLKDRRFQDSVNWINEKKNLDQLSVEEEIAAWERIKNNQSNNIEAKKQAELNLYKLRNQIMTESYSKEEKSIQHLTKLGVYSAEQQIEAYRELYKVKAKSMDEEQARVENLFGLYQTLLKDQQKNIKDAYDDRINRIDEEAKRDKEVYNDRIKDYEKEISLINERESEKNRLESMADLMTELDKLKKEALESGVPIGDQLSKIRDEYNTYKHLIKDHREYIKESYEERIKQIENETKAKKEAQEDIIKGIEKELELLNKQEQEYTHEQKMADLQEQLKYWQVRTSEDARKKVAEILKRIDEEEHKREVELEKQGLEKKKRVAQDEIRNVEDKSSKEIDQIKKVADVRERTSELVKRIADAEYKYQLDLKIQALEDKKRIAQEEIESIERAANEEKERWRTSYRLVEEAFDDHSMNIIALASTMSKGAFKEWERNYLRPLQRAFDSGDYDAVGDILGDFDDYVDDSYNKSHNSSNARIYRLASQILDYKRQYEYGGDKRAAQRAIPLYDELEKLKSSVADKLHRSDYLTAKKYIDRLPRAHTGAKTLSYGAVYMKPGELIFPPDLSTKMESLIEALYARPTSQNSSSLTDNRKEFRFNSLLNIENNYMEDDVDGELLARELKRQIVNIP